MKNEKMDVNIRELLTIIQSNPDLPVICMVDGDVCSEDYGRWMAQIGCSEVGEYATYNERFYDDREEFKEDYYNNNDEILDERFGYDPRKSYPDALKRYKKDEVEANKKVEEALEKYLDEIADKAFRRAIIVYIDTPDDIEEFEDEKE